jgi:putative hydrolase of the HAD superfamily
MAGKTVWDGIQLVVFDVDGTLYRQRPLRLAMAVELLADAFSQRNLRTVKVLRAFRRERELAGSRGVENFEAHLYRTVCMQTGAQEPEVRAMVADWMEQRPIARLPSCAYPGVAELFDALRRSGRIVGVLSDYPIHPKLQALGLSADYAVSACDPEIGVLKPHPKGLQTLMERAGVAPANTLLIGDRASRDGEAARAAGARALLLTRTADGYDCFQDYRSLPAVPPLPGGNA